MAATVTWQAYRYLIDFDFMREAACRKYFLTHYPTVRLLRCVYWIRPCSRRIRMMLAIVTKLSVATLQMNNCRSMAQGR